MKVKDILKLVCEFVGERQLQAKLEESGSQFTEKEQEKINLMVNCFNLVQQEIASDYLPFLTKEEINVENSILNFSDLSKVVINIYEIKNRFGICLKFKLYPNYVEITGKAKSIVYSYLPSDKAIDDEVDMFCGLTARVMAYGIASEYLLIDGVSQEAEIWEDRFKTSLFVLSRKRGEHTMPKRTWF